MSASSYSFRSQVIQAALPSRRPWRNRISVASCLAFASLTFQVEAQTTVAGWLDSSNTANITFQGSGATYAAAGLAFSHTPAVAQAANGDVFLFEVDGSGNVWMDHFTYSGSVWSGWQCPGGALVPNSGMTAAVGANGFIWFAGRDSGNRYWINSWNGTAFSKEFRRTRPCSGRRVVVNNYRMRRISQIRPVRANGSFRSSTFTPVSSVPTTCDPNSSFFAAP